MKKRSIIISLLLCCFTFSLQAQNFNVTNEDGVTITYGVISREEPFAVKVTLNTNRQYNVYDTVRVPATVTWRDTVWNVTETDYYTFSNCTALQCVELPESITYIRSESFSCSGIISFRMPSSVTDIDPWAFFGCQQLTEIELSPNITILPNRLLLNCHRLRFLKVPEGVITIDTAAVYYCRILDSISLPSTLQKIMPEAFKYNSALSAITVHAVVPPVVENSDVFLDVDRETTVLHVPAGCIEAYRNAPVWSEFANIQDDAVGIATTETSALRWHVENNAIVVESAQPLPATLYDAMGRQVLRTTLQGNTRLDVPHSGLYILRHGNKSNKIIVP